MQMFGIVNSATLNLREKASSDSNILAQLPQNTVLDILDDAGFGWLHVKVEGTGAVGYVSKIYLTLQDSTPTAAPTTPSAPATKGVVSIATLNMRSGAGTTFDVVTKLSQGTVLEILATSGDWLKVSANGQQGYVAAQYVTLQPATSTTTLAAPTPAPTPSGVTVASGFLASRPDLMNASPVPDKLLPPQTNNSAVILARTWNSYGGLISKVARILNIGADIVTAVLTAESGGRAFADDGRMIIRFENHIFYNYWGKNNVDTFNRFFNFDRSTPANSWKGHQWRPSDSAPWQTCHTGQDIEWTVLAFARNLDDTAALSSISMGAPQIMGFNFRRLGYNSVQDMFTNFTHSANAQLLAMFDFVHGPNTIQALQNRDFTSFATIYNGPANAATYSSIIQNYSNLYDQLIGTAK